MIIFANDLILPETIRAEKLECRLVVQLGLISLNTKKNLLRML